MIGALAEVTAEPDALRWMPEVAPYRVAVLSLAGKGGRKGANVDDSVIDAARHVAQIIANIGPAFHSDVILDDRQESNSVKLRDARLCGFPFVVIVSHSTMSTQQLEVLCRWEPTSSLLSNTATSVTHDATTNTWNVKFVLGHHEDSLQRWLADEAQNWNE